jgi:chromate transport protein ChrA
MDSFKHFVDIVSITNIIATLAGLLPPLAALVSIAWVGFQFYHSPQVQTWMGKTKGI